MERFLLDRSSCLMSMSRLLVRLDGNPPSNELEILFKSEIIVFPTSLTEPTCPGSLYRICRVVVSHTYTNLY